ncbi:MAG: toll/interleukin-1 receptor domain-containing protein [Nitrososphaerota archaeon]|nr:toll/interleukin-1 receptor domain-containing protein [Nitrososphaerota archaeon]
MEIDIAVRGAIEMVIVDMIYSWPKIKRLAKSLGIDPALLPNNKSEAACIITENSKSDINLIIQVLKFSKKGMWDRNYFKIARETINPPLQKYMHMSIDEDGKLIDYEKFGIRKPLENSEKEGHSFHFFLSHSTLDLAFAKTLKEEFERYGFSVFLAHNDIDLSADWVEEILLQLRSCKAFIALLTTNFRASDWCAQESGIAYINNLKVLPLNCDGQTISYGFIGKYQARPLIFKAQGRNDVEEKKFRHDVNEVVNVLMGEQEIVRFVRQSILRKLSRIENFHDADCVFSQLLKLEPFSEEEAKSIAQISNSNSQIYNSGTASEPLKRLISKYRDLLSGLSETSELLRKLQ